MSHPKAHKITFSLRDQFKKLQNLSVSKESNTKPDLYFMACDHTRQYVLFEEPENKSENVILTIRIQKDDKNANGVIILSLKKNVFVLNEHVNELGTLSFRQDLKQKTKLIFTAETSLSSYGELRTLLSNLSKKASNYLVLDALNQSGVFGFDLSVLVLDESNFINSVLKRDQWLINEMTKLIDDLIVVSKDKKQLLKLNEKERAIIEHFVFWNKVCLNHKVNKKINELLYVRKMYLVLKNAKSYALLEKIGLKNKDEKHILDYNSLSEPFDFTGMKA